MSVKILIGDVREKLRELPEESVHCVVTSPPYWGLRDYGTPPQIWGGDSDCEHEWRETLERRTGRSDGGRDIGGRGGNYQNDGPHSSMSSQGNFCTRCGAWRGNFGQEPTPDLYIAHIVEVFRELRRVLRKDGTVWLNLGDNYAGSWGAQGHRESSTNGQTISRNQIKNHPKRASNTGTIRAASLKPKDLCMMPARVALALQADGWWLRSEIIWAKPNPMPESVTDRPTSAHEKIYLLARSERYFFDAEAVKEMCESGPSDIKKMVEGQPRIGGKHKTLDDPLSKASAATNIGQKRSVGNPEGRNIRNVWTVATAPYPGAHFATFPPALIEPCIKAGCPEGGTVLDPFGGAGTTGLVADRLKRNAILIELNPEYATMARKRIERDGGMFAEIHTA